jgi:3-oxoacyl-[acyl-carrier protein] reductase
MDLGLRDKVAVVFASSRGLGKATALALAEEGCHLALCSRNAESIRSTANEITQKTGVNILHHAVDVTQPDSIQAFAKAVEERLGVVHILVNNSGGPKPGTFDQLTPQDFAHACQLLLMNVVQATQAFLPLLRKSDSLRRILTITSTSTREVLPQLMLSNSLRSAVVGWSKTLARELASEGFTVNCVAPGTIDTERIAELIQARVQAGMGNQDQVTNAMLSRIPQGRFGEPREFANALVFLASQASSYINGTTLYVDGAAMSTVT